MADYPNTPVVSVIQLPSGNDYYVKDADARAAIDELEQRIAGGMGFKIVWTQADWESSTAPTSAKLATIPTGVVVHYNSGASTATGTLAAGNSTLGNFYLTYSNTQVGSKDYFNEYATISENQVYTWEKIGDTQVDLTGVVTGVSINTSGHTDTVIGTDSTFTITQPTITLTANASTADGRLKYVEDVTGGSTSPTKVHLSASASGGAVSASGDSVTAVTGVSTAKLATTTVTGVSGSTNITPIESRTSQTTADGTGTASSTNTDWLKGVSVSSETLVIGAATMDTQTTYSAGAPRASLAVPTAAANATTVATGGTTTSGSGATVATGSSGTDTVLGTASTFSVTNPSITISTSGSTGPEVVGDVSDITVSPTYKYMSGSASGANTAWNNKDSVTVLKSNTTLNVTKGTNDGE